MILSDDQYELLRRHGFGVAYRMLGSVADAEDVVQEALLRLAGVEQRIEEPSAWITTVTTRLAIDHLRLARVRRETYVGSWLPDPLLSDAAPGPSADVELADSLSQAFLIVLEQLTPVERAVFLLREVFDYDYAQIAEIVERSEPNCRQLVTRARKHVNANRSRFDPDVELRASLFERFMAAAREGDLEALEQLLAEDAVLYSDGGGKAIAARYPIAGANRVARVIRAATRKRRAGGGFQQRLVTVGGQPGRMLIDDGGIVRDVLAADVVDGRIQALRLVRNPDKLAHLEPPPA